MGFIFAYFGDGEPPPFPVYPDLDRPGVLVERERNIGRAISGTVWTTIAVTSLGPPLTSLRMNSNYFLIPRKETDEETDTGRGV